MAERQNLSVLHAPLKISLSEGACWHMTCQKGPGEHGGKPPFPLNLIIKQQDTPYPNGGNVEPVIAARAADGHSAREDILAHLVLAAKLPPHAVHSTSCGGQYHTRMMRRQNLSVLHAVLHPNDGTVEFVSLARASGNYFVRKRMLAQTVPTARKLLFRTNLFMINGVWGCAPCSPMALDLDLPTL